MPINLFNGGVEESIIIILLHNGPTLIRRLPILIKERLGGVTKQNTYRIIRKLKKEQKVKIMRSVASIDNVWLRQLKLLINDYNEDNFN